MKKTLKYTTLAALAALAAGAIPAYAEKLSLDYTKTSTGSSQEITTPSIYTPEVTAITASDDLNLTYTVEKENGSGGTVFTASKNFTVNDVTVSATTSGKVWTHQFLTLGQNTTTTFNSLNYTLNAWGQNPGTEIQLNEGSTFTVLNNITYTATAAAQSEINFFFTGNANTTLNVGGNIELAATDTKANLNLKFHSNNVNIGGVIKLNNDANMKRIQLDNASTSDATKTYNRSFGGLSINKGGQLRIEGTANNTVNLTFTNSTEESYSGYLMAKTTSSNNKVNITMNATSTSGKQTLRFLDATDKNADGNTYNNAAIDTVSVSNGTLSLGMNSAMSANKLVVNGEKAVFDITSADGASEIGKATFDSFEGLKGAIAFDFAKDSNDFIDITGTANASSDLAFIVNMTKADFDSFLGEGETSLQYNIISFTTEGSSFDATTVICSDSSLKGKIDLINNAGTTSVMLTITAVPEPATVAAILGAVALAFATYRRRK